MGVIMIFIEMILVVMLYNSLFNKGKLDNFLLYCSIVLVCSVLFYKFSPINVTFVYVVLLIAEIFALAYVDRKDKNLVLTEMIICVVTTFIIQNSLLTIIFFITGKTREFRLLNLILYAISIFIIIGFLRYYRRKKYIDLEEYIEDNLLVSNILLNIFMFFMILKIIYDSGKLSNGSIVEINFLIFINILLNISFYRSLHKTILKNKNIEVKNAYNPLLDEIIQNIRANEHEYKNHISMLYSMIQVSKSIPEIKEKAGSYIGNITNTNVLSTVLDIESATLKAILYSKLVECEQLGINLSYTIKNNIEEAYLDDTEITIILSNLLNNAIEATKESSNKKISIDVRKLEKYKIEVKNNISGLNIDPSKIENFFNKGFSSKGNGRGYGLYNVKKIVKKYKGTIYARVVDDYLVIEIFI
ncbi:sensor histidine kinase [Clostridium nigeriense]|uniref:sensor histidine kinase n=1 Tax=Clostridium nigeriense TaxID=1805470 RepID=UPI003D3407A2